jgi:predicted porin
VTYNLGEGFSIGGAMSSSKRTADQNNTATLGEGDHAEVYSGGLKYDANNIYLARSTLRPTTQPVSVTLRAAAILRLC